VIFPIGTSTPIGIAKNVILHCWPGYGEFGQSISASNPVTEAAS
jgi:hypothetical protein